MEASLLPSLGRMQNLFPYFFSIASHEYSLFKFFLFIDFFTIVETPKNKHERNFFHRNEHWLFEGNIWKMGLEEKLLNNFPCAPDCATIPYLLVRAMTSQFQRKAEVWHTYGSEHSPCLKHLEHYSQTFFSNYEQLFC